MQTILPVLDTEKLQQAVNEYAMKGALETYKDFYSGWSGPYRKAIEEKLKEVKLNGLVEIPDIIAVLNESISAQLDQIANEAIARTFLPQVKAFLTREAAEMPFSDFLKEFINLQHSPDREDCSVSVKKHYEYDWLNLEISNSKKDYSLTLHLDSDTKNEKVKKYYLLSLPFSEDYSRCPSQKMTLTVEGGASLEMPFRRDILSDRFTSFIARLVIAGTRFTMDCDDFSEDMFPQHCHCD